MKKLTDRQKKIAAVGIGGLFFVLFLLRQRAQGQGATATTSSDPALVGSALPTASGGGDMNSGSADNTGALSGMSNDITGALGQVSDSLGTIGSNESVLYDQLGGLTAGQAAQQASIDQLAANLSTLAQLPATAGAGSGQGAVAAVAAPAAAVAAVKPKTVVKGGKVYHYYDTDPKKAGAERKIYVRPASTPRRSPSQHPAAVAAPKRKAATTKKKAAPTKPKRTKPRR